MASSVGWRRIEIASSAQLPTAIVVALYYPTPEPARRIAMGPFTPQVAINARPDAMAKGLIVLSHGTGGTELGHTSLAEALALRGYLVAAIRHPGDNFEDRSLLQRTPQRYFVERPRHVSRAIDAILDDPEWGRRITRDAGGPRIGALGHSAGGYTVLALAGGRPDPARIAAHCAAHRAADPIFCGIGRDPAPSAPIGAVPSPDETLLDPRVRAVVAMAPVGVVLEPASLATIRVPSLIYIADEDRFLVPRFHADGLAASMPGAELRRIANAWHFAFMDKPTRAIPTEDGDVGADPPGFDRPAFLERLKREIPDFFDRALQ